MTITEQEDYVKRILSDLNTSSYFYEEYVENTICNFFKQEGNVVTQEEVAQVRADVFSKLQKSFPGCY